MTHEFGFPIPFPLIIAGPIAVFALAVLGWLVARFLFGIVAIGLRRSPSPINQIMADVLRMPVVATGALIGVWLALRGLPLSAESIRYVNRGWIVIATVLLVSIALRALDGLTRGYVESAPNLAPAGAMIRAIGRIAIISLGGVMLLQSFGIAVEPLIASLGIGSLAVALALRDTLSNFFAGLYIHADHPFRIGHYVKIENGEEGYVLQIGWRSTRIRNLSNNIVVVPNEKLAQAIMTNFDLPDPSYSFSVNIPVPPEVDPERIISILNDVMAQAAPGLPGLMTDPPPSAAFGGFGDNGLIFSLNCRSKTYVDQYGIRSTLQRLAFERFAREGIPFPFPARAVRAPEIAGILAGRLEGTVPPKSR